jgi:hypothetical protein
LWRRENELVPRRGASLDFRTIILNRYDLRILLNNCATRRKAKEITSFIRSPFIFFIIAE